jgi:hypothetical protein
VELDTTDPPTPRFNMPFELGLAVAWDRLVPGRHTWYVMESRDRRVFKSLSDLAGTDIYVHDGTPDGVFRELGNALVRQRRHPFVREIKYIYAGLQAALPGIMESTGARSMFAASVLRQILLRASGIAGRKR